MTSEYLLNAIGLIDDDLIAEADEPVSPQVLPKRRIRHWVSALAACLVIALGVRYISTYLMENAFSGGGGATDLGGTAESPLSGATGGGEAAGGTAIRKQCCVGRRSNCLGWRKYVRGRVRSVRNPQSRSAQRHP